VPTIETWLRQVGLEGLTAPLLAQDIDLSTLRELREDDLREIGMTLGQRKSLLRAVREHLGPIEPAPRRQGPPAERPAPLRRRPMTVLFCDIVGSTKLTERLEADDWLEALRGYRSRCCEAIGRHGGFVARFIGDGIFAYFGHPVAHESDAERAVRAALAIVEQMGTIQLPDGSHLQVRLALATGMVVVGDLSIEGALDPDSVVGATPNLASRLQDVAPPGGVVVSATTYRLIEGFFRCEPLGPLTLAGIDGPVTAWRVLAERKLVSRFRARSSSQLQTPLVARDAELARLRDAWDRARRGDGRFAVVVGEAGIGKSRLVEAFAATVRGEDALRIAFSASPYGAGTPLGPLLQRLHRITGRGRLDSASRVRRRLARACPGEPAFRERAAEVLAGLVASSGSGGGAESPGQRKSEIFDTLQRQFDTLVAERPLLITVDDLHWLDPSSLELLGRLAERRRGRRVLIVVTTRQDPTQRWLAAPEAETIRLQRLGQEAARSMLRSLFGGSEQENAIVLRVVERAEGVPLVLEEFARSVAATSGERPAGAGELTLQIPDSLYESLIERLDQSGPARHLVDIAAVIGGSISPALLARISGLEADVVESGLRQLRETGILERENGPGEFYVFRHALLRDAAYESLLREPRRAFHAQAAAALAELQPELVDHRPEILARHLTAAGATVAAAESWLRAARRSLAQSALEEAVGELRRGLALLRGLPRSQTNAERCLEFIALLGPALFALRGPGSREVEELYAEGVELCRAVPEAAGHFPVYWGWWRIARDFRVKRERADELLMRARERNDPGMLLQAHHCAWASRFSAGDLAGSREHIDAGLAIYDAGEFRDHAALYGNHDAKTCAHCERALVLWQVGQPGRAAAEMREAATWTAALDHIGTRFHLMDFGLALRFYRREVKPTLEAAATLAEHATRLGFTDHHARGTIFHGWGRALSGDPAGGAAAIEQGLERLQEIGTIEDFPLYHCMLAEALAAAGRSEQALALISAAQTNLEARDVQVWMPEMWRWIGDLTRIVSPAAAADADSIYGRALALADRQGATTLALRAALSRARLWSEQGRDDEAAALLATRLAAAERDSNDPDRTAAETLQRELGERMGAAAPAPRAAR